VTFAPLSRSAALAVLLIGPALLGGCSSRDTVLAEKVAAADAAAQRAEMAAQRAENAAKKAEKPAAVQVDAEPEEVTDPGPDQPQEAGAAPNHG